MTPFANGGDSTAETQYVNAKMKESTLHLKADKLLLLGRDKFCVDEAIEISNASRTFYVAGRSLVEETLYHGVTPVRNWWLEMGGRLSILDENIHQHHTTYYVELVQWISQLPWGPLKIDERCGALQSKIIFKVGVIDQILDQRKYGIRTPASVK